MNGICTHLTVCILSAFSGSSRILCTHIATHFSRHHWQGHDISCQRDLVTVIQAITSRQQYCKSLVTRYEITYLQTATVKTSPCSLERSEKWIFKCSLRKFGKHSDTTVMGSFKNPATLILTNLLLPIIFLLYCGFKGLLERLLNVIKCPCWDQNKLI